MNVMAPHPMTVDEFLAWSAGRPGRYELIGGIVQQMSPERAAHVRVKFQVCAALKAAIRRAGLDCEALTDGMTVRIDDSRAFVPDALVHCQADLDGASVEVPEPVIVVEVLSASTSVTDTGAKLAGYFALPSIAHYLIVDADERTLIHHRRASGDAIDTRILRGGSLTLDPPGLVVAVPELFQSD